MATPQHGAKTPFALLSFKIQYGRQTEYGRTSNNVKIPPDDISLNSTPPETGRAEALPVEQIESIDVMRGTEAGVHGEHAEHAGGCR